MKRWIVPIGSLSAVAVVVALTLFLAGVFDGDDASGTGDGGAESAAVCAEDHPDCGDTLVADGANGADDDGGDTVAPGCEVGHVGVCNDTPIADGETGDLFEGDGPALQPACALGLPDCDDTVLNDNEAGDPIDTDDGGISVAPLCIESVPDCADTIVNGSNGDLDDDVAPNDPIVLVDGERDAIDVVLTDAQTQFGVDDSAIVIEDATFQEWSNSCLDAAEEGESCDQAITPGFVVVIEIDGTQYEYHTDLNGNARLAV